MLKVCRRVTPSSINHMQQSCRSQEMLFLCQPWSACHAQTDDGVVHVQERASGMYRLSAFYFARSASDLPFEATPSLFVFIIYFMVRSCPCSATMMS